MAQPEQLRPAWSLPAGAEHEIALPVEWPPEVTREWEAAIRRCAISAHDLLLEHPWACRLALIPSDMRVVAVLGSRTLSGCCSG